MGNFDIRFIPDGTADSPSECRVGEVRIESFCERFVADVTFWRQAEYEKQWLDAALKIVGGDKTALIVSVSEPATANFVRWWAMYRNEHVIFVQEQIRFLDELSELFDPCAVERFVLPRETVSEDGELISEWSTTVSAVRDFIARASVRGS